MSIEREKQVAAEAAAELVESGMTVGLGTGSTVAYLLPALAKRSLDILCAATSPRTEHAARELGLRIEDVTSIDRFDITIDGADQIAPDGWLVKGGGGAHTREKIVAGAADQFVVIADSSKPVPALHAPARRPDEPGRRRDRRLPRASRRPGGAGRPVVIDARGRRPRPVPASDGGHGPGWPGRVGRPDRLHIRFLRG
jgi:acyl-CoA hydrolase